LPANVCLRSVLKCFLLMMLLRFYVSSPNDVSPNDVSPNDVSPKGPANPTGIRFGQTAIFRPLWA
jgi:hypothetical protein